MRPTMTKTTKLLLCSALVGICGIAVPTALAKTPFNITVGPVDPAPETSAEMNLEQADIQIRSDNMIVEPSLNVTTQGNSVMALRDEGIKFYPFWNYGAFIERAEIRIFNADESTRKTPRLVLPVVNETAELGANSSLEGDVIYVLRVYDEDGRFDETEPKFLSLVDTKPGDEDYAIIGTALDGYGIDRTAVRNIKIRGTSITIFGQHIPETGTVTVMGTPVPIDVERKFAREMILPYGDHQVDVKVASNGRVLNIERDLFLDSTNFFYVSIGDLTLGSNGSAGPADFFAETDEDFDDVGLFGRGALYAKGKVAGDYQVTAAIDTGEDRLEDIFTNLDEKDPRQLLRRLDGDRFYPVYGDDSQIVEDAPTQGRFFIRVEKDDSHVMWGNFATQITGTEFAHLDRGLYGGIADIKSQAVTESGDRKTRITAFAADPGTLPVREEFRGTGGSLYFFQRQDLSIGSERLRVEVRDKVSGLVIESHDLRPQDDYDIDYIQGRVILSSPLQSYVSDNEVVRTSSLSGHETYLVARYEYTPVLSDVDGYTLGGRATHWLGNHLRIGATAQKETTDVADQNLVGVDALLKSSESTYLKMEYAHTDGPGFGQSNSVDGGFNFNEIQTSGVQNLDAAAYRIEGSAGLRGLIGSEGTAQVYYDHQDAGFSGAGRIIQGDLDRWGAAIRTNLGEQTEVSLKYDEADGSVFGRNRSIYGDLSQRLGEKFSLTAGVRHDDSELAAIGNLAAVDGSRTDGTLQVDYTANEHIKLHGFVQLTLDHAETRSENDRYGIGAEARISERVTLSGEVSDGDFGFGAQAKVGFKRNDNSEYYLGYALSTDNRISGLNTQVASHDGTLTVGGRKRFGDTLSVYGEERFGHGRLQKALTHVYGLNFNPNATWSFGLSVENGTIEERSSGEEFERTAFALSAGRVSDNFRMASNLEARFEDSKGAYINRDRETYLMRNTIAYDANENFEMLGRFNFAISDSDEASILDADFVEGVIGAAYRPINNDRLNALIKYTYFEDLAPASQITSGGTISSSRQKSQIFSADAIYDLTEKFSIGAKYGYRSGEVAFDRTNDQFIKSDAYLGVIRLDYHVISKWDVLAEARMLGTKLSDEKRYGALVGLYRHLGDNSKIGAGYNFASFSDDLTDFNDDSDGFFINLIGKF